MNFDVVPGLGADFNVGMIIMLQGPEAGTIATFNDGGAAVGADVSAALADGLYFYTGDISNLTTKSFVGIRKSLNLAASFGADIGLNINRGDFDDFGGRLWSVSFSVGLGASPYVGSGNLNDGETYNIQKQYKIKWPW